MRDESWREGCYWACPEPAAQTSFQFNQALYRDTSLTPTNKRLILPNKRFCPLSVDIAELSSQQDKCWRQTGRHRMPKKQTGIRPHITKRHLYCKRLEHTILLANPPKPPTEEHRITCFLCYNINGDPLLSMCKLTLTFGSSGKGLYGNTESTWQLHSVWMSFISMWPLIYLKSLFKIFLSKSIHTVFGL